ncbi:fluoride efflux transporter CrcB [Bacillus aquiflavi]|uniref:Fluoride-specific ion channel FluC n=2 Tax=Bacillus aquiflavi TaxID=2672567 RepID=A0A6B3VVP2_9BACI|nr:fluoride efflux transporter CrcB [Bacillus aquiflavi]MBA4535972.1 fluoride efflux transporter CrcB [Bacillus aquiflavi]NEY80347.1 fluoride efflux transporter CrcB [Bacillus aquiflavi]UAC50020.1 fluoride efflux transporter CrcB [Bacillus aquiflavi]
MIYLFVGIGGAIGSIMRYFLSIAFQPIFPIGTFAVNIIGSFCLGLFHAFFIMQNRINLYLAKGISVGLIGSFTTFSAFSNEMAMLINDEKFALAFIYIFVSLFGGLLLAWTGFRLGRLFARYDGDGNE